MLALFGFALASPLSLSLLVDDRLCFELFERRSECTSKTRELSQLITYPPIGSPRFFVVHKNNFELNRNSEMAPFLTLYYVSITRSATPLFFLPIKTRTTSLFTGSTAKLTASNHDANRLSSSTTFIKVLQYNALTD